MLDIKVDANSPYVLKMKQWMDEQDIAFKNLPEDPFSHWDPEDDYNKELDYAPSMYYGKGNPDLSHLDIGQDGRIKIQSLPDIIVEDKEKYKDVQF